MLKDILELMLSKVAWEQDILLLSRDRNMDSCSILIHFAAACERTFKLVLKVISQRTWSWLKEALLNLFWKRTLFFMLRCMWCMCFFTHIHIHYLTSKHTKSFYSFISHEKLRLNIHTCYKLFETQTTFLNNFSLHNERNIISLGLLSNF